MGNAVQITKTGSPEPPAPECSQSGDSPPQKAFEPEVETYRAVVPTIDLYAAGVLLNFARLAVEEVFDRKLSQLEEKIAERDREVMQAIRRIQARLATEKKVSTKWWQKLFGRRSTY